MKKLILSGALVAWATGASLVAQVAPAILKPPLSREASMGFERSKLEVVQAIAKGEFEKAMRLAEALLKQSPDDLELRQSMAQAYRRAGKLDQAEKTTQWLLDMRPEFAGGLWEAALLREEFKDLSGAVDLLNEVYHRTPASKTASKIAILRDLVRIFDKQDNKKDAAMLRKEILRLEEREKNENAATEPI